MVYNHIYLGLYIGIYLCLEPCRCEVGFVIHLVARSWCSVCWSVCFGMVGIVVIYAKER